MRRYFVLLPLSVLFAALIIFSAQAQQPPKVAKIGILADVRSPPVEALLQGLRDLGYLEGQNILIEYRYAEGKRDRLPDYAADLIRQKVDLIVAIAQTAPYAAKSVKEIPVVFGFSGDAVDAGLVTSLARPGGNVTGMSFFQSTLAGKRVELLKEVLPALSRVAVLANPGHPGEQIELRESQTVARALGISVHYQTAQVSNDFGPAFDAIAQYRGNALITFPDGVMLARRQEIAKFAAKQRLASVSGWSEFADAGGLMTYGPNFLTSWRRVAVYVDKVLKGAKAADLPVEQPTKFELVINLKAAKQIGLAIPPHVLARADRIIR